MKKFCSVLLILILIVSFAVPVHAAAADLILSKQTAYRGDTVTVTLFVSGISGAKRGGVTITHDAGLTLKQGAWKMNDLATSNVNPGGKTGVFLLNNAANLYGNILQLTFAVNGDAAFGAKKVTVALTIDNNAPIYASTTIQVACNHTYSNWANWSATTHYHKCSTCGQEETAAHVYDNPCDTACNVCGATRTTEHQFGEEWTADETGHWHKCIHCEERKDFAEHIPGEEATEYTDQVCTECEFVLVSALGHVHKYDDIYGQDKETHWQTCTGCGENTEAEPHIFSDDCDTVCDTCKYERRVLHNPTDTWHSNSFNHWKECQDCQGRIDQGEHIWDEGTVTKEPTLLKSGEMVRTCVICNAQKTETVVRLTVLQWVPWWGWLSAGAVAGFLVTFIVTRIVISAKAKKNSKGRFVN